MFRRFKQLFVDLPRQLRLAYCLMRAPQVPVYTKAAFGTGLGLLLSPFVNVPEVIPFVGELDAAAITLIAVRLFIAACPADAVMAQEQLIIEQRSVFDDDVRRGERVATAIFRRFGSEERSVVGVRAGDRESTPESIELT